MKKDPTNAETIKNPPAIDVENLASATECTGLIPSAISNEETANHYAQLYDAHVKAKHNAK